MEKTKHSSSHQFIDDLKTCIFTYMIDKEKSHLDMSTFHRGEIRFKHASCSFIIDDFTEELWIWCGDRDDVETQSLGLTLHLSVTGTEIRYVNSFHSYSASGLARYIVKRFIEITQLSSYIVNWDNSTTSARYYIHKGLELLLYAAQKSDESSWRLIEASKRKVAELTAAGFECIRAPKGIYRDVLGSEQIVLKDGGNVYGAHHFRSSFNTPAEAVKANPSQKFICRALAGGWRTFNWNNPPYSEVDGKIVGWSGGCLAVGIDKDDDGSLSAWSNKLNESTVLRLDVFPVFDENTPPFCLSR